MAIWHACSAMAAPTAPASAGIASPHQPPLQEGSAEALDDHGVGQATGLAHHLEAITATARLAQEAGEG